MATRVAIIGFGCLGRDALKRFINNPEIEVVAINDEHSSEALANILINEIERENILVKYDEEHIILNDKKIPVLSDGDFSFLDRSRIDVIVNGMFTDNKKINIPTITQVDSRKNVVPEKNGYIKKYSYNKYRNKY